MVVQWTGVFVAILCAESQSVRRVCYLEANVVHRGGSNQKYRNKMAASRDSVTGKYFM